MVELVGTCYEDAWRFLIREEEGELVHGSVQTIGKRINHAWVELPTGFVWEPESGEFMKKSSFYERAEPQVQARYSVTEAAIMLSRVGKHGPWTKEEREQFLKRGMMTEPWQMTRGEYGVVKEKLEDAHYEKVRVWLTKFKGDPKARYSQAELEEERPDLAEEYKTLRVDHHQLVKRAIEQGKPVPAEVLKDYPDLAKKRSNPEAEELDLARTLAIIDSRPKGRIIESKLREEFGDAVIDALRQGRYVVSGSAGYDPPLLVSLKGRELIQGGNPMKTEEERKSFHERIFGKGAPLPLQRLGRGETVNELLPMSPDIGPPLPRMLAIKWPWKK